MVKLDCIICTDEIKRKNLTALVCGHMYHTNCVIKLVKKRTRKCPICRNRITWTVPQLLKHKSLFKY